MYWNTLIDAGRLALTQTAEPEEWNKYDISEFEKDYKKIIASSAFRRLQDKTQVFPLDKSDFVRTRLTHSLEVSMIAKQLGTMICTYLLNGKNNRTNCYCLQDVIPQHIGEILMSAGLLHDLGNPPFGHFGETVMGDWFKKHFADPSFLYNGKPISKLLSPQMRSDLEHFEGNAQSIRILLKSCIKNSSSDLDLTNAVIHTLIKYPTNSLNINLNSKDIKVHKMGYFHAEEKLVQLISTSSGTFNYGSISRHPLTFLLEAADDIAYATGDVEDAFKKGLFSLDQFIAFYENELLQLMDRYGKAPAKGYELISPLKVALENNNRTLEADAKSFNEWVKTARGWLMYCAAFGFTKHYSEIMNGQYTHDLFKDTFHELSIKALKKTMNQFAYHSSGIVKLELSAQTIISFLLDKMVRAVLYFAEEDKQDRQTAADRKFIDLISENYKNDYLNCKSYGNISEKEESYNLYLRLLIVTDYISGMTDSFAKNLYQELNGII